MYYKGGKMKIKDEELITDLKQVKEVIGKIPSQNEYSKIGKYSKNTYIIRKSWTTWLNEVFELDIKPRVSLNKIADEELLEDLLRIYEIKNSIPKSKDLNYNLSVYQRAFGSFTNALRIAGFHPSQNKLLSPDEILNDLRRVYEKLGRSFSRDEFFYYSNTTKSGWVIVKHFGSWHRAMDLAGIETVGKEKTKTSFTDEDIIKDIKRVYGIYNRPFTELEFISKSNTVLSCATINKKYGNWNNALRLANVPINKDRRVDIELLKNSLKNLVDNDGINSLNYWNIYRLKREGKFPYCCGAIKRNFPNLFWEDIMRNFGFDYKTNNQFRSKEAIIGRDGNTYLSLIERRVGNVLFRLKNEKLIDDYEYNILVCKERLWTCDFKIYCGRIIWIEVDGMLSNRHNPYNSGKNEKIEYYKDNNYNLIIITYFDSIRKKILKEITNG